MTSSLAWRRAWARLALVSFELTQGGIAARLGGHCHAINLLEDIDSRFEAWLTATDAQAVENAFRVKLAEFEGIDLPEAKQKSSPTGSKHVHSPTGAHTPAPLEVRSTSIDKSVLLIPEPRRLRDKVHVKWVSKRPCLICGRQPSDPHHLRFAQQRAVGRKVSDEFIVPLCRTHHREVHRSSDEVAWWKQSGIDALDAARKLWRETHTAPIANE